MGRSGDGIDSGTYRALFPDDDLDGLPAYDEIQATLGLNYDVDDVTWTF